MNAIDVYLNMLVGIGVPDCHYGPNLLCEAACRDIYTHEAVLWSLAVSRDLIHPWKLLTKCSILKLEISGKKWEKKATDRNKKK